MRPVRLFPLVALCTGALSDEDPDLPDPDLVKLAVTFSGSGCPGQSVSAALGPYSAGGPVTTVRIDYSEFSPAMGPGINTTSQTQNCNLHFRIDYPDGWEFAVYGNSWNGYAELDRGVNMTLYTSFSFNDESTQLRHTFQGGEDWDGGVNFGINDWVWPDEADYSICNLGYRTVTLNNRISLTGEKGLSGWVNVVENPGAHLEQEVHLSWRNCTR